MKRWVRIAIRLTAIGTGAWLLASGIAGWNLAQPALHPSHSNRSPVAPAWLHFQPKDPSIQAADGAQLQAWYVRPAHPNGAAVILLHGMADSRLGVAGYASMFLRQGYAVLLPDSRAHGASGGDFATYGVLERDDIRHWAAWLKPQTPGCEYLFGESMGAAIAIQASALTPAVCAVTAEASFASFREIANDRISQVTHLGLWFPRTFGAPAREFAFLYGILRFHVNLADASPLTAIRLSHVPTLLICGTADDNIPMRHSLELFQAGASHSQLWIVEGAEHTGAAAVNPPLFEQRVVGWFDQHSRPGSRTVVPDQ
ncbi:MAG TPA: alpha/beta fold hydrolase [Acidobacteriaceae bacterium]|nr:alpha/beta fold hydrolase [Acidobacteriaceae bacterium]